ncbi:MAG TPA: hypothetical protein O0X25_04065 [Methanocorpusculum sp.]|nr:hypothetical protein [Methanocorpusculum sp.]HJJ49774.1 hypothetical protein [Methanocorpusculum sp.]HJJ57388.1 hypothetical protein [Methanocorpusculum sp.]
MTGETYVRRPEGKVINRGEPLIVTDKVLTAAAVAGSLMIADGNDYKTKKSDGSRMPAGWLSFEHTDYKFRPTSLDSSFVAGDTVAVVAGGDFEVYAFISGSADEAVTVSIGTLLTDNGDGTLTIYNPNGTVESGTAKNPLPPVAIALESMTIAAGSPAVRIAVKSLI